MIQDSKLNIYISAVKERIFREGLQYATDNSSCGTTTTESTESSPPPKKKTLGSILKKSRETQQPKTPEEKIKVEVDSYISVGALDSESDPLDWWRVEQFNYLILGRLAKNISAFVPVVQHLKGFLALQAML